jgi:hypothetical protein
MGFVVTVFSPGSRPLGVARWVVFGEQKVGFTVGRKGGVADHDELSLCRFSFGTWPRFLPDPGGSGLRE